MGGQSTFVSTNATAAAGDVKEPRANALPLAPAEARTTQALHTHRRKKKRKIGYAPTGLA